MTRARTLWLVGAMFALGLLLIVIGALVDPAGIKGVAWNSDWVVRDGVAPHGVAPIPGENAGDSRLGSLTLEEYRNRLSWAIVSGVLTCVGILVLAAGHFLLFAYYALSGSWMLPETAEGRVLFRCYLGALYVLAIGAISADVMGAKVSGTGLETYLVAEGQAYYAVARGGETPRLKMQISEAQYLESENWNQVSLDLFFAALAAAFPFSMFLGFKTFDYIRRRESGFSPR